MSSITKQTLRIVDANLNRLAEGLRFIEEIARMVLDDVELTQQLKDLRHNLIKTDIALDKKLLEARDSMRDVGIDLHVPGEKKEKELASMLVANARRTQESLRVLEEAAKLPGINLDSEKYKHARFALYTIEKDLLARITRQEQRGKISGLYVIIDTKSLKGRGYEDAATRALRGGAKIIQLRDDTLSKRELLTIAEHIKKLCNGASVPFIICDHLDVALGAEADGIHLEPDSLPVKTVRGMTPMDFIIGCSVRDIEEARQAEVGGADYVSLCPTCTGLAGKKVCGVDDVRQLRQLISIPVVAIGGINKENIGEVAASGANAIAVVSAVLDAENIEQAARQLAEKLEERKCES